MSLSSPATPVKSNGRRSKPDFVVPPPLMKADSMQEPPYSSTSGTTISNRSSPTTSDDIGCTDHSSSESTSSHSIPDSIAPKCSSPEHTHATTSPSDVEQCDCGNIPHLSLDDYRNGVSRIKAKHSQGNGPDEESTSLFNRVSIANEAKEAKQDGTFAETADGGVCIPTLPNSGRLTHSSNTKIAQGLFPHDACLFVGNLPKHLSDKSLTECVESVFNQYGQVYVTIHRGENLIPYGFCQYTTVENAKKALAQGKGQPIANRPCRVEPAKGTRSFFVHVRSRDGHFVDEATVQQLMSQHGPLEKLQPVSMIGTNPPEVIGFWVVYCFWLDASDASKILKDHPSLNVEKMIEPGTFKSRGKSSKSVPNQKLPRSQSGLSKDGYVQNPQLNSPNCVFLFDVSPNKSTLALFRRFQKYGAVKHTQIMTTKVANDSPPVTSAIIEYYNIRDMNNAVLYENNSNFATGEVLRVAPLQTVTGQQYVRYVNQVPQMTNNAAPMIPQFPNPSFMSPMPMSFTYYPYGP